MALVLDILRETWFVTAEMAPWLLLGFLVAGVLSVWLSPRWLEAHLGGRGLGPAVKASVFGVPLPLCSCGVIPVAASLRRAGASRAATTAFLLSTPQTGVDSIAVTYSMLGPVVAIMRPLIALVTGFLGGGIVASIEPEPTAQLATASGRERRPQSIPARLRDALDYGLVTLPADIGRALLVGVLIAGVLAAVVPEDYLAQYLGGGVLSILVLMGVGVPLYVCATASVPIAAGFIHLGVSPGAALAFLIAGPATNAATITTVWRFLGRRTTVVYLVTVVMSALGGGLLLNAVLRLVGASLPALHYGEHAAHGPGWFHHLVAVLLAVVVARALGIGRRWWPLRRTAIETADPSAQRIRLAVSGMNCSHCTGSVQRALEDQPGVQRVVVDLDGGFATVEGDNLEPEALAAAVAGIGFPASVISGD